MIWVQLISAILMCFLFSHICETILRDTRLKFVKICHIIVSFVSLEINTNALKEPWHFRVKGQQLNWKINYWSGVCLIPLGVGAGFRMCLLISNVSRWFHLIDFLSLDWFWFANRSIGIFHMLTANVLTFSPCSKNFSWFLFRFSDVLNCLLHVCQSYSSYICCWQNQILSLWTTL